MVVAVVLIFIIGMTLSSLGFSTYMQMMRTQTLSEDAQLRQLLLAGMEIARGRLQTSAKVEAPLALPDSLGADAATLALHLKSDPAAGQQTIQIDAAVSNRRLSQTVQFAQRGGAWQLTSAELMD